VGGTLSAAVADFGDVEVTLLVDAHSVRLEEAPGIVGQRAPSVEQVAVEIILDDPGVTIIRPATAAWR